MCHPPDGSAGILVNDTSEYVALTLHTYNLDVNCSKKYLISWLEACVRWMLNNVYIWCIPADPIMGTPFSLVTSKMNIYLPLTWIYQIYPLQKELHLCSVVFPRLSSEQRLGHKNCFGTPLSSNSIPIVQQRVFRTSAWKCQPSKSFAQLQYLSRMVRTVELLNSKTFSGISAFYVPLM